MQASPLDLEPGRMLRYFCSFAGETLRRKLLTNIFCNYVNCLISPIALAAALRGSQNVLPHNDVPRTDPYAKRARFALRMKLSLDAHRRTPPHRHMLIENLRRTTTNPSRNLIDC